VTANVAVWFATTVSLDGCNVIVGADTAVVEVPLEVLTALVLAEWPQLVRKVPHRRARRHTITPKCEIGTDGGSLHPSGRGIIPSTKLTGTPVVVYTAFRVFGCD
jgi:hypothetical protein